MRRVELRTHQGPEECLCTGETVTARVDHEYDGPPDRKVRAKVPSGAKVLPGYAPSEISGSLSPRPRETRISRVFRMPEYPHTKEVKADAAA